MRIELATTGAPDGLRLFVEVPDDTTGDYTLPAPSAASAVAGTTPAADSPAVGTPAAAPITHDENTVDISETGPQPDPVTGAFNTQGTTAQTVDTPIGSSATPPGAAVAGPNDTSQQPSVFQGDPTAPPAQSTDEDTVMPAGSVGEAQANGDQPVTTGSPAGDQSGTTAAPGSLSDVPPEPLPPADTPAPDGTIPTPGQVKQALIELGADTNNDGEVTTDELNALLTSRGLDPVTEDQHAAVAEAPPEG